MWWKGFSFFSGNDLVIDLLNPLLQKLPIFRKTGRVHHLESWLEIGMLIALQIEVTRRDLNPHFLPMFRHPAATQ